MFFRKYIYLAGTWFRNPSLWKHLNDLRQTQSWDLASLKKLQEERLLSFLKHTAQTSPYYRKLFTSLGWKPNDAMTMDLFRKIPVMTKNVLIEQNDAIHSDENSEKLFLCETSGTSGQVLTFRRNESWDSFNRAAIFRGYSWYDVNPWDYNLYFWGYNIQGLKRLKLRLMDFLVNRYRMFGYSAKTIQKLVQKIGKTSYIEGYSSMIYELACEAENKLPDVSHIKMVKGTSEKIYPQYVEKTRQVFGKGMISEYGAAETGIIAFECPKGNMHLNMEGVYVEIDEEQEIIVTNFHSYSFPVIRYRLGDAVAIADEKQSCGCGMSHPVLMEVTGRIGKRIYGESGVYPSLTFYYIFKNLFFEKNMKLNYQAHQHVKGEVVFWIREPISQQEQNVIAEESYKYFKNDIKISFRQSTEFRMQEGKLRDFVSELDI